MTRPLRLHIPGMLYHVISRGNARQAIFTDDADYERYLQILMATALRFDVRCAAYCLLVNHVHLLLQPQEFSISRMMQQLNSTYSQWFNREHDRVGHLLQGRFKALLVDSDAYFLRLVRYILWNPVAAGRVRHPADWPWSSYRATAGLAPPPPPLSVEDVWGALGADDTDAAHQQFILFASAPEQDIPDASLIIGSDAFVRQHEPLLRSRQGDENLNYAQRFAARPPLAEILRDAQSTGSSDAAMRTAFCRYAYTLREIGVHVGRPTGTIWAWVQRAGRQPDSPTPPSPSAGRGRPGMVSIAET